MAGNVRSIDETIPAKDRSGGLDRSDEELQRASTSGVGRAAQQKREAIEAEQQGEGARPGGKDREVAQDTSGRSDGDSEQ